MANRARVVPVQGATTMITRFISAPIGPTSVNFSFGSRPAIVRIGAHTSSAMLNLVSVPATTGERIGKISAPSFFNFSISGSTFSIVQWDPVSPNPILTPESPMLAPPNPAAGINPAARTLPQLSLEGGWQGFFLRYQERPSPVAPVLGRL